MKQKTSLLICAVGGFLTLAGYFSSLAAAPSQFATRYGIPNEVFVHLCELSFLCGVTAALAMIVNALPQRSQRVQSQKTDRPKLTPPLYTLRSAEISEL